MESLVACRDGQLTRTASSELLTVEAAQPARRSPGIERFIQQSGGRSLPVQVERNEACGKVF